MNTDGHKNLEEPILDISLRKIFAPYVLYILTLIDQVNIFIIETKNKTSLNFFKVIKMLLYLHADQSKGKEIVAFLWCHDILSLHFSFTTGYTFIFLKRLILKKNLLKEKPPE